MHIFKGIFFVNGRFSLGNPYKSPEMLFKQSDLRLFGGPQGPPGGAQGVIFIIFPWGPPGPPRGPKMDPGTPGIDLKSSFFFCFRKFGPEVSTIFEIWIFGFLGCFFLMQI